MMVKLRYHASWLLALAAFLAGAFLGSGCGGPQPLLTLVSEEQQPLPSEGSWWSYQALSGGSDFTRSVTTTATVGGVEAAVLQLSASPGGAAERFSGGLFRDQTGMHLFDVTPSPGQWRLERKLPYVVGASWALETPAGAESRVLEVHGMETVETAAGTFERCYRLLETTFLPAPAFPDKTEALIWVDPAVGDIQYGTLDATGNLTIDYELTGFYLAP